MSYIFNNQISYSDSPNLDAFGRLRVSEPYNIFNSALVISSGETIYEAYTTGGGFLLYNENKSEVQFNVTGSGQRVLREQHGYNEYQPGKSQLVLLTGNFGTSVSDVTKRMGYYNDTDGLFFQLSGSTFGVVLRTSTSGVPVETFIPQSQWNLDTLITGNTLNPSGINLNTTKTQIFIINFQWLGVGRVIFALDIGGITVPVHEILNANNKDSVYMKSGTLPVRYEVISQGGTDSTFKQICSAVSSEGGQQDFGFTTPASNGLTFKTISAKSSIISVRLAKNYKGVTNRTYGTPISVELSTTTNSVNAFWELILQKGYLGQNNLGGSPTWNALNSSPFEYSVDGTTVVGGDTIASGFIITTSQVGNKSGSEIITQKQIMALDYSGVTSDMLHLVVTPNNSSAWSGIITMKSYY